MKKLARLALLVGIVSTGLFALVPDRTASACFSSPCVNHQRTFCCPPHLGCENVPC